MYREREAKAAPIPNVALQSHSGCSHLISGEDTPSTFGKKASWGRSDSQIQPLSRHYAVLVSGLTIMVIMVIIMTVIDFIVFVF